MEILIPARGGSKGIRDKNLRVIHGKPLIAHAVETALGSDLGGVTVSTDSDRIASVAERYDVTVEHRHPDLATDHATVDELVEAFYVGGPDWGDSELVVYQPTTWGVTPKLLRTFVKRANGRFAVAGVEDHGIHYREFAANEFTPVYPTRVNRQDMRPVVREVGLRYYPNKKSTSYDPPIVLPLGGRIIEIDTHDDLHLAQRVRHARISITFAASREHGLGHMFRCIQLAKELAHHDVRLSCMTPPGSTSVYDTVTEIVRSELGVTPRRLPSDSAEWASADDVHILDILDTSEDRVLSVRWSAQKVITLEDRGPGRHLAHRTINALYEDGPDWVVLRPEFVGAPPPEISPRIERVLVTFGGTDPLSLTERFQTGSFPYDVTVIEPPYRTGKTVNIAGHMRDVDVVICSGGRTLYEAAALGIPAIVLCQNRRELTHTLLGKGNVNFGIGSLVSHYDIVRALRWMEDPNVRKEMSREAMAAIDGRGAERIARVVEDML